MRAINKDEVINMIKSCIAVPVDNQWDSGYNTAMAEIKNKIENMPTIEAEPCTFCAYNPPSSGDGKPCTMCPAVAKGE